MPYIPPEVLQEIKKVAYHHNAVFVGMDKDRVPRYAALRGIGTDFIGEASGSDKNYSFSVTAREESKEVHLFESAIDLLSYGTLVFYLKYEAPEEEQNFPMVMELLRAGEVHEDEDEYQSPLDELFERLEMREPDHIAVKYYKDYHSGSAKTLKSIQITLASRLEKFNLSTLAALTVTDDLELATLGEKKTALFALIPDNDTSYNFLVSILYTQLFQQLFYLADHKYGGRLPVHVHFLMEEFANVSLPDDFDKILSVMRSREVSVSIILQNLAQLKALFEKQWESIVGNCDEFLYLGGNEQGTHKYVSELLGKSTIDMNTYGKTTGHMGNYSTNYQISGRELLTPDEVRMLDNRYALLFIRGERPIMDEKFDILKHPNLALTPDGDGEAYRHGEVTQAVASISLGNSLKNEVKLEQTENIVLELLSEEDLLGVETNITNWQRRQNANNNFSAVVPYDMEQQRKESKEFLDDLTTRDQRMMFAVLTLVHTAESKEQLDSDTDPRSPNEILEPEYSIYCGVLELKDCLIENEVENPIDIENIRLALQQYNAEVEDYDSLVLQYYIYAKNLIESHI